MIRVRWSVVAIGPPDAGSGIPSNIHSGKNPLGPYPHWMIPVVSRARMVREVGSLTPDW